MATAAAAALRTATLVVRRPLITPTRTAFEQAYYEYHANLRAGHERTVIPDFWTKKGAAGNTAAIQKAVPAERTTQADTANDVKSLDRKLEENLFLVVKEGGKWSLVQGAVAEGEPLHEVPAAQLVMIPSAARRSVLEKCGQNLDLWMVGRSPIALSHTAKDNENIFVHKAHILTGQAAPTKGVSDFAWVTKSEMAKYLDKAAYDDVVELL
ncbi:54S ribosomal protein L17 mitochondrial [Allomyces arbusculus]|nr:54S ribosomal protein L17 mitochondrial [Allomyces arbusculus]